MFLSIDASASISKTVRYDWIKVIEFEKVKWVSLAGNSTQ